jgi:8-oxo-dGTP pyrophosphatase MutT (NUDIX family)
MSRAELRALLAAYRRDHPREAPLVDRFVALLLEPACFERDFWRPGHVTGSAWLLDGRRERVLLTHHRKLGRWLQLGGHADGDEDVRRVACREAMEESGLEVALVESSIFDIDVHEIPARGADPAHLHFDLRFALCACGGDDFTVSAESHALRWVSIAEVAALTDELSMRRMAEKWRLRAD